MNDYKLIPQNTFVVGDNAESEIAAANKLNMVSIQILRAKMVSGNNAKILYKIFLRAGTNYWLDTITTVGNQHIMKKIKIYQIDAFTDRLFSGNPAAVCIIDKWIEDELMQSIANENNLAETAFVVLKNKDFEIRWFTPTTEVDLCGHATLAAAYVLFDIHHYHDSEIRFHSVKSGLLTVSKKDNMLFLDFPTDTFDLVNEGLKTMIENCIGIKPIEVFKGKTDYIAIIDSEYLLKNIPVDLSEISKLDARGLIVTAQGDTVDFVSRFFAPQSGIDEDPVTGSAHTSLIPIWSEKLGRKQLIAKQLSKRGGQLFCEFKNERCLIGGSAKLYLTGEINLD